MDKTLLVTRFVGIDLHKHFVVVAAVNAQQQILLKPTRRIDLDDFPAWAAAHLGPQDAVVLEATGNAWWCYDHVVPLAGRTVVANPLQVKWIAAAAVKTDKHDALKLAKLLAANLIPEVWVPPPPVRELRALLSHRHALIKQQTAAKNRLHSVLHRHHLTPPEGELFATHNRDWWGTLDVSPTERLRAQHDIATLDHLQQQLADVETELSRLSMIAPWRAHVPYLIQLPGIALLTALTVLAAIGDITRFPAAKQLVGYAGLGAGIRASGESQHDGHITKQGRRDLRRVLIEAAWSAVNTHPYWKAEFARLCHHKPQGVAIVAIARKLLVAVWHVLSERAADTHAEPVMVASKLMRWSWQLTLEQRGGLTSRQFIRYGLLHLQLGAELRGFTYGGQPRAIAPPEEILALFPELQAPA
jgi:transposase